MTLDGVPAPTFMHGTLESVVNRSMRAACEQWIHMQDVPPWSHSQQPDGGIAHVARNQRCLRHMWHAEDCLPVLAVFCYQQVKQQMGS